MIVVGDGKLGGQKIKAAGRVGVSLGSYCEGKPLPNVGDWPNGGSSENLVRSLDRVRDKRRKVSEASWAAH